MTGLELDGPKASVITDHAFVPKGEWYTTCGYVRERTISSRSRRCGLAEAAHRESTLTHTAKVVVEHEVTE